MYDNLEYHKFSDSPIEYIFSRTYEQFKYDLNTNFNLIFFDDGYKTQLKAMNMAKEKGVRINVAIITYLIGVNEYMTEDDIRKNCVYHDFECHTHTHRKLTELSEHQIKLEIIKSCYIIYNLTSRYPKYLIPPWDTVNDKVKKVANGLKIILVENRKIIKNDTIL